MSYPGIDQIPNFLKARSPLGLRRLMKKNSNKLGGYVKYTNMQFAQGYWYCWFEMTAKQELETDQKDRESKE